MYGICNHSTKILYINIFNRNVGQSAEKTQFQSKQQNSGDIAVADVLYIFADSPAS